MNSVQESKNELDAAIRYAENAISSAKQTIESMEFRQEMAQKNYQEQTGREQALEQEVVELTKQVKELEAKGQGQYDDIVQLERDLKIKTSDAESWKQVSELQVTEQKQKLKQLAQQKDDLEREVEQLKAEVDKLRKEKEASSGPCGCQAYRDLEERATMPVIPKAVAIAIFREGMAYGAGGVCDELENAADIEINAGEYCGGFEVSFSKYIDLSDHIDLD